jgi:hypothetical protein
MRRVIPGAAVLLAACVHSSAPKALTPQVEETVSASPSVVFQAALKSVTDQGLPLRESNAATLVIQTNYVDVATYDPLGAQQYPTAERMVRFKVLIAPGEGGKGSSFAIFGLYAPFQTGYSSSDRNERPIPRDHPAMAVLRRIHDDIIKNSGR